MPPKALRAVSKKAAAALPQNLLFQHLAQAAKAAATDNLWLAQHLGAHALAVASDPSAAVSRRDAMQMCSGCGTPISGRTCSSVKLIPISQRSRRRAAKAAAAAVAGAKSQPASGMQAHNVVSVLKQCKVCGHANLQPFASQAAAEQLLQSLQQAIAEQQQQQQQQQQPHQQQQQQQQQELRRQQQAQEQNLRQEQGTVTTVSTGLHGHASQQRGEPSQNIFLRSISDQNGPATPVEDMEVHVAVEKAKTMPAINDVVDVCLLQQENSGNAELREQTQVQQEVPAGNREISETAIETEKLQLAHATEQDVSPSLETPISTPLTMPSSSLVREGQLTEVCELLPVKTTSQHGVDASSSPIAIAQTVNLQATLHAEDLQPIEGIEVTMTDPGLPLGLSADSKKRQRDGTMETGHVPSMTEQQQDDVPMALNAALIQPTTENSSEDTEQFRQTEDIAEEKTNQGELDSLQVGMSSIEHPAQQDNTECEEQALGSEQGTGNTSKGNVDKPIYLGDLYAYGMAELRPGFRLSHFEDTHHPWWKRRRLRYGAVTYARMKKGLL